jgi:hypothetical protein
LDTVIHPLESDDSVHRQEPASVKKMAKGDSAWSTVKVILGWVINTVDHTISLPAHCLARIHEILDSISSTQSRVSLKKWQHVMGELLSMALTIPTAIGILSVLQQALKTSDGKRVRLISHTHAFLQDFHWLVEDVGARLTAIDELAPYDVPSTQGACDMSKKSLGGFTPCPCKMSSSFPLRQAWLLTVASNLVSTKNLGGTITNINLELSATIAQFDVFDQMFDVRSNTIYNLSNNAATVAW